MKDLTIDSPGKVLWKLSLPMFISVIFQQFYNISDSVIAGKFAGESALAAVGASHPVTMIFMAIAIGINIGCSVVISQLFGAKEFGKVKTAISTTMIASLVLSIVLTVVGFIISNPIMKLIKTPDDIFANAAVYLNIYIAGLIFLFLYNVTTGIFIAMGDSKTPLYFLIFSSILNVVLDAVFVIVFKMGVSGVAWATFIAQGIACVLAMLTLFLKLKKIVTPEFEKFSVLMLKKIGIVAVPSILQQSFISVGNIFIQGIINGYGSSAIAGFSASSKLNIFTLTSLTTLANGVSSFAAQNIGAGKLDRVKKGFKAGLIMAICVAVPFFLIYFIFNPQAVSIFMDSKEYSQTALQTGSLFLKIVTPFYVIIAIKLIADAVLRGAGMMRQFMVSTFTDLLLRVVLAFILSPFFGIIGVYVSWPIGWIVSMIISVLFYKSERWAVAHR